MRVVEFLKVSEKIWSPLLPDIRARKSWEFLILTVSANNANLLDQLRTAIREKRLGKLSKGVLLQQDNARVHTCKVVMDVVERNGYELILHPAYSPDLAPSDFFLFPNLKKDIRGLHFRSDEEVVTAVDEWVNEKDPDFFSPGLMALAHRWSKCITLEDNYIVQKEVDLNRK